MKIYTAYAPIFTFCTQDQSILLPHPMTLLKSTKIERVQYLPTNFKITKIYSNQVRQASSVFPPPLCHRKSKQTYILYHVNQNVFKHLGEKKKAFYKKSDYIMFVLEV